MSHFEYVSVAFALIYTLAIGRLLGGLYPAFDARRRYWIHLVWVCTLLLVVIMVWWLSWRSSEVTWTPIRFLAGLALPGIVFMRAGILLGDYSNPPESYREHFYRVRVPFFSLGVAAGVLILFIPWVYGTHSWFTFAPVHPNAIGLMMVSAVGLYFKSPGVQGVVAVISLVNAAAAFFIIPVRLAAG